MVDQGPLRIRKQFSSEVLKRHVKRERERKKEGREGEKEPRDRSTLTFWKHERPN